MKGKNGRVSLAGQTFKIKSWKEVEDELGVDYVDGVLDVDVTYTLLPRSLTLSLSLEQVRGMAVDGRLDLTTEQQEQLRAWLSIL